MANPKLPGISESEQALLYAKLNEYNRGRASFKEAGESPTIPFGSTLPCPKSNRFSIYTIYLRISTSPCG